MVARARLWCLGTAGLFAILAPAQAKPKPIAGSVGQIACRAQAYGDCFTGTSLSRWADRLPD
ncbi:MAG: hypothetical protein LBH68_01795 [Bifidobacteriaceae bacterium]|jgi:hypothetical protein|nr:hypothetical protein [Bifidobacteriaceae bacterium]